jgi:hypothetical protein
LKLKTPWRDGTTPLIMSALDLMQRRAALVPRPRLHLIRFHACWRRMPGCWRSWCRKGHPRRRKRLRRLQPPSSAKSRLSGPGCTASVGRGCSSVCSTSTCSTARRDGTGAKSVPLQAVAAGSLPRARAILALAGGV